MGSTLPEELIASISQQWHCRDLQIRQLINLLCPTLPSPPAIFIHGPQGSGKSSVVRTILEEYGRHAGCGSQPNVSSKDTVRKRKQKGVQDQPGDHSTKALFLSSTIRVAECITARHLLVKIVTSVIAAIQNATWPVFIDGAEKEWLKIIDKVRCEHVSTLPAVLSGILGKTRCEKYVLLLDGVDELREGGQMLLAALARMGEMVSSLCVIFASRFTPRPLFLQVAGVPHIYFPPYSRNEMLAILSRLLPPPVADLPEEIATKLYPLFLATLYDSLVGPAAGTVPFFRSASEKLWPKFVSPIVNQENPPGGEWDFSKLLVKNRALFQQQGEHILVHHIVSETPSSTTNGTSSLTKTTIQLPALPYLPTLVLTAAFLAAYIPQRLDTVFFSKFTSSKKKRIRRRGRFNLASQLQGQDQYFDDPTQTPTKSSKRSGAQSRVTKSTPASSSSLLGSRKGITNFLTPRPFSLERLLAIYHAIDPNPSLVALPVADAISPEIATLQRLRLLVPASSAAAASGGAIDGGEKWCLNVNITVSSSASVNEGWIVEMARGIGVDIDEYLAID
ncbi:origin recognition complex subunit 5 [Coccidioides immitis RS]|uniref:Origin recognition complex subunit 5 n=3 Tax=Coccidioides immitis TaxID=5501 RepID=A0A0E1RVW7_COCIM|nr:origin recognition complex subunit 5 [Coccidioides immitis RS]EAS30804.1 origin recognition complex subunit 5 [Coccidioides immitis RS]KMP03385.1 hypothetical protein CIRG_03077 [Coccidioides immitis RMSCC 2394]KMU73927.1 hypothetical protein CISG_03905 [Coccidioides immitis RMSCC 3703]TPX23701.1 hypothetical protein DIZ76_013039 [Coccidioides immitis]